MANATLVVTATLTNGGTTKDIELEQCKRVADMALHLARSTSATGPTTITTTEGNASATAVYTAVAPK